MPLMVQRSGTSIALLKWWDKQKTINYQPINCCNHPRFLDHRQISTAYPYTLQGTSPYPNKRESQKTLTRKCRLVGDMLVLRRVFTLQKPFYLPWNQQLAPEKWWLEDFCLSFWKNHILACELLVLGNVNHPPLIPHLSEVSETEGVVRHGAVPGPASTSLMSNGGRRSLILPQGFPIVPVRQSQTMPYRRVTLFDILDYPFNCCHMRLLEFTQTPTNTSWKGVNGAQGRIFRSIPPGSCQKVMFWTNQLKSLKMWIYR